MSKNPWNRSRLESYVGTEEMVSVEFKSSRGLMEKRDIAKSVEGICQDVSGFLNGEGGLILIGLDEGNRQQRPDIATGLSVGVTRSTLSASRLESMLCDQIHPSVADLVRVFPIPIGGSSEDPTLAYAVEVRAGVTAYQAPDKKYYVRRGYSSQAMEDKDIRLRMLNNQVARARIGVRLEQEGTIERLKKIGGGNTVRADFAVLVQIRNIGLKTIRQFSLNASLKLEQDDREALVATETSQSMQFRCTWPDDNSIRHAIHPDDMREIPIGSIAIDREMQPPKSVSAEIICYLEDAPAVSQVEDITDVYREAQDAMKLLSEETTAGYLKEIIEQTKKDIPPNPSS